MYILCPETHADYQVITICLNSHRDFWLGHPMQDFVHDCDQPPAINPRLMRHLLAAPHDAMECSWSNSFDNPILHSLKKLKEICIAT
jgi:hypothetical protein